MISGWVDDFGPDFDENGEPIADHDAERIDAAREETEAAKAKLDHAKEETATALSAGAYSSSEDE